jgi:nucleoside-diphosphate-sugar epimerase
MNPSVLILGGRGRFGLAAARAFSRAGWQVAAQIRPGASAPALAGVRWLPWELGDIAGLAAVAGQADVVVHALNPPSYGNQAWREQAPVFMDAAIELACRLQSTLMFPGNVYNFGRDMPELLTEETAQRADTVKGRLRIELEQKMSHAAQQRGLRSVVIRGGDFFGAGRGSWFDRVLVKDISRGVLVLPGDFDTPTAWAYLPDLADSFVQVARRREQLASFECFHFPGHQLDGEDWQRLLEGIMARPEAGDAAMTSLQTGSLPWWLLRLGAPLMSEWAALVEMRYLWQRPHRLQGDKLRALIGTLPHTPIREAVAASLRELGLLAQQAVPSAPAAPGASRRVVLVK